MIKTLDLYFRETEETIAAFLIETSEGAILFECGPYSVFAVLEEELAKHNYTIKDIKHLFLTHIHFDHAGAAWALAANGTKVYVHPRGIKHLHAPERLYASAQRIYGDQMEMLWGKMEGIPLELLHSTEHNEIISIGDTSIKALHTPGHAVHHIAWKIGDNIITGDVAGCRIDEGIVVPPCPPPDINLEDWGKSIDILLNEKPKALYLTHFGEVKKVKKHLEALRSILWNWANFIKLYYDMGSSVEDVIPTFSDYTDEQLRKAGASEALIKKYSYANPAWMSVAGLMRYWKKKDEEE